MQDVSDDVTESSGLDSVDVTFGPFKLEIGINWVHVTSLSQYSLYRK